MSQSDHVLQERQTRMMTANDTTLRNEQTASDPFRTEPPCENWTKVEREQWASDRTDLLTVNGDESQRIVERLFSRINIARVDGTRQIIAYLAVINYEQLKLYGDNTFMSVTREIFAEFCTSKQYNKYIYTYFTLFIYIILHISVSKFFIK